MASPAQIAANRRNAQNSSGPRTIEGKKRVSMNALKSGLTAKTVVLPHESATDYNEIRAALIQDYAPATTQELMLVDQIAAGYWRTIRARRFETEMFDNRLRTRKRELGMDQKPDAAKDDEGYAVMLQITGPEELQNYFRYDATISRDYYRAIATLEKMQAARRREEERQHRQRSNRTATIRERTSKPQTPEHTDHTPHELLPTPLYATANAGFDPIGFVSHSRAEE